MELMMVRITKTSKLHSVVIFVFYIKIATKMSDFEKNYKHRGYRVLQKMAAFSKYLKNQKR